MRALRLVGRAHQQVHQPLDGGAMFGVVEGVGRQAGFGEERRKLEAEPGE